MASHSLPLPSIGYISPGHDYFEQGVKVWGTSGAKELFEKCLECDPDHKDARYNLVIISYYSLDTEECLMHISLLGTYKDSRYYEGMCYLRKGDTVKAKGTFSSTCQRSAMELARLFVDEDENYRHYLRRVPESSEDYLEARFLLSIHLMKIHDLEWKSCLIESADKGYEPAIRVMLDNGTPSEKFKLYGELIESNVTYVDLVWESYYKLKKEHPDTITRNNFLVSAGLSWKIIHRLAIQGKIDRSLIEKVMHFFSPHGSNWEALRDWAISENRTIEDYPLLLNIIDLDESQDAYMTPVVLNIVRLHEGTEVTKKLSKELYKMGNKYLSPQHSLYSTTNNSADPHRGELLFFLSECLMSGDGCNIDIAKSHDYLKESVKYKYRPAILRLAWKEAYTVPETIEQLTKAKNLYEQSVRIAALDGRDLEIYNEVEQKIEKMKKPKTFTDISDELMVKACNGNKEAAYIIGMIYYHAGDLKTSKTWISKALGQHLVESM